MNEEIYENQLDEKIKSLMSEMEKKLDEKDEKINNLQNEVALRPFLNILKSRFPFFTVFQPRFQLCPAFVSSTSTPESSAASNATWSAPRCSCGGTASRSTAVMPKRNGMQNASSPRSTVQKR